MIFAILMESAQLGQTWHPSRGPQERYHQREETVSLIRDPRNQRLQESLRINRFHLKQERASPDNTAVDSQAGLLAT